MMDFEEFKAEIVDSIKDHLPEKYADAEVSLQDVTKNNDRQLTGLLIRTEDSNITPTIYLESFFEQYQDGKDINDILDNLADIRQKSEISQGFDANQLTDLDMVKDHIICKLVNADMNQEYLANKPHTMVEDLAVMYAVDLGNDGDGTGHMSAPITYHLLDEYGITVEELHNIAMQNLSESNIEFKTMRDVLVEMMFPDGIDESDPRAMMLPPEEEIPSMYVLTNEDKINGAVAVLDPKTMEEISEKVGGDFYVLPSSLHEVIILPDSPDMDRATLENMVRDINAGQVAPEDRLSDNVYMYDSQEKELVLADKMEERLQARAEAYRDSLENHQDSKPGREDAGEKKPEHERVSLKQKIPEKKAEAAKNEASREKPVPNKTKEASRE